MEWLQVVVLGLVQGISEFLPVSSSAHLILVPVFTPWEDQGLAFDVALHVGSLSAVIMYFWRDLWKMAFAWTRSVTHREVDADAKLAWAVLLGTIPVGACGLLFQEAIETHLRSPIVLALSLIVFGVLLGWADWKHRGERSEYQMSWKDVAWIAFAQALALIPGTSRSGITMTAALLVGMSREGAARFSFLLSIPVIALAGMLEVWGLVQSQEAVDWATLIWGTLISGVSAYACIHYFLVFIRRIGMQPFVIYRIALGIVLLAVFL
ncbi:undecaprenyl-diphosphate phosphatase [Salinispirillum marinum]|uniref:Undecaprenyl-diphosphatase n=2 Tax=Saccharospirillaceae TaxID=255527 RepID=A0ABV8BGJ7_9GAMM